MGWIKLKPPTSHRIFPWFPANAWEGFLNWLSSVAPNVITCNAAIASFEEAEMKSTGHACRKNTHVLTPSCSEGLWHYELWIDGNPDLEDQYISDASNLFKTRQRKFPPFWPPRPLLFQVPQRCFNCTGAPGKKWGLRREFGRDFWVEVSWVLFLVWQHNLKICQTNFD